MLPFLLLSAGPFGRSPAESPRIRQNAGCHPRILANAATGPGTRTHMKKDSDLDPLRARVDFKKLLAELDTKTAAKPEKQP